MFERPEKVIPAAVKTWQGVLASLFPETGKDEHFQKVKKRVSLETCEKTQPTSDGPKGLVGPRKRAGEFGTDSRFT